MHLPLPLPDKQRKRLEVLVRRADLSLPWLACAVFVPPTGNIVLVKEEIASLCSIKSEHILIADVFNHVIYKEFDDADGVGSIGANDTIVAYEIPPPVAPNDIVVRLSFLLKSSYGMYRNYNYGSYSSGNKCGRPVFIHLQKGAAYEDVCAVISRYVRSAESAAPQNAIAPAVDCSNSNANGHRGGDADDGIGQSEGGPMDLVNDDALDNIYLAKNGEA